MGVHFRAWFDGGAGGVGGMGEGSRAGAGWWIEGRAAGENGAWRLLAEGCKPVQAGSDSMEAELAACEEAIQLVADLLELRLS